MSEYKDKCVLVVCSAMYSYIAERLARDFGRVLIYIQVSGAFPYMNCGEVASGLKGVEKVDSIFGPHFDEVDLFCFPDLGHSAVQIHLEKLGKRVWGGRNGEELESYRELCKELMEKEGLPVQPWKKIVGVKALREHLKANPNQYVKFDKWRGVFESFRSESYDLSEVKIDQIANDLGAFQHTAIFIVEDELPDCVEIGTDLFTIDGMLPKASCVGLEIKDLGYVGQFIEWETLPEPIRRFNETMSKYFEEYGYRGWLCTEIRISKDHKPYMIDLTARQPSPPGELLTEFYTNYSDILWHGADGVMVDPIPAAKYGVEVVMRSDWAKEHWQPISYDPAFENQIKLFNSVIVEGQRYIVPQNEDMAEIGAVVGWGDTLDEAVAHMKKAADTIKGFGIKIPDGSIDDARKGMEELAEFGLPVFDLEKS